MSMVLPQFKTSKYFHAVFLSFVVLIPSMSLGAENVSTEDWQISADEIIRYDNPQSIVAKGNIVLIRRERLPAKTPLKTSATAGWSTLLEEKPKAATPTPKDLEQQKGDRLVTKTTVKADWMAYDVDQGTIRLRGHVDIVAGDERLVAEQGVVNLTQDTGDFNDATITMKKNQIHLEGKSVEKTGALTYRVIDGWIVTCQVEKGETPPWSFSSTDTTITQGGYALMKNVKFNIKGVPVFYTPYMVIPAKDTRQTGFLFPEMSFSKNKGYGFDVPFFYNISDSTDLTFFPEYYKRRGFKPGLEFRYVRKAEDKGTFAVDFLHDKLSDPSEVSYYHDTGFTHTNKDRYWIRGKADTEFGNGWIARLDLDIVSDRDYLTEFNSSSYTGFRQNNSRFLEAYGREFQDITQDQRQNTFGLLKSWTGMSLVTDFQAVNDVRIVKSSPTPLWRLPGVDFSGLMPIKDSRFNFSWDANYVEYWRQKGIGGQRVDLHPKVSTSLPLGPYLESLVEFGARETFYSVQTHGDATWDQDDTPNRTIYNAHTEVATTLVRDFDFAIGDYKAVNHKLRPYVQYDYTPDKNQDGLPYFDRTDLIDPANTITYGVDNFFDLFKPQTASAKNSSKEYGYLKIKQSYFMGNVRESILENRNRLSSLLSESLDGLLMDEYNYPLPADEADDPLSPVNLKAGWKPLPQLDLTYRTNLDVYGHGFLTHSLGNTFTYGKDYSLSVDYRYNKLLDVEQINFLGRAQLLSNVRAEMLVSQSLSQSQTNEENFLLTYQAPCWSVSIKSSYTPTDKSIMLIFNLANIGAGIPFSL